MVVDPEGDREFDEPAITVIKKNDAFGLDIGVKDMVIQTANPMNPTAETTMMLHRIINDVVAFTQ